MAVSQHAAQADAPQSLQPAARAAGAVSPKLLRYAERTVRKHDSNHNGQLDADEWAIMKTHAALGADAIERAVADTQEPVPFLLCACQIARHHHERWDGSGYPDGLAGDAIPLSARLMAVADVFDALISRRVYKAAFSFEKAYQIIIDGDGKQFDPAVIQAFIQEFPSFVSIAQTHTE